MRKFPAIKLVQVILLMSLAHLPAAGYSATACPELPPVVLKQLKENGVTQSTDKQTDYGRYNFSSTCYLEAWPKTTEQTATLVKVAYQHHMLIRTQGGSHSQNGTSLPRQGELLIHTNAMNVMKIVSEKELIVGSGIPVTLINTVIKPYGIKIPVVHDAEINGPTVGGFIAASGAGPSSNQYGGFWDQVSELTLVTGYGKIMKLSSKDPLFLWMFGSMGQLGIVTEAHLKTIQRDANIKPTPPVGKSIVVDFKDNGGRYQLHNPIKTGLWMSLLVAPDRKAQAMQDLEKLEKTYGKGLVFQPIIIYEIQTPSPPPLVWDNKNKFYGIMLWAFRADEKSNDNDYIKLSDAFTKLVIEKKYKRYIQSELSGSPEVYKEYFSPSVYEQFKKVKAKLDPEFLFNQGSFFPNKVIESQK